jgi:hypothetical protein
MSCRKSRLERCWTCAPSLVAWGGLPAIAGRRGGGRAYGDGTASTGTLEFLTPNDGMGAYIAGVRATVWHSSEGLVVVLACGRQSVFGREGALGGRRRGRPSLSAAPSLFGPSLPWRTFHCCGERESMMLLACESKVSHFDARS